MNFTDQMFWVLFVALMLAASAFALLGGRSLLFPLSAKYFRVRPATMAARGGRLAAVSLSLDGAASADRNAKELLGGEVRNIGEFVNRFETERTTLLSELRLLTNEGVRFEQTYRTKAGKEVSLVGAPGSFGAVVHLVDDTKLRWRLSEARNEIEKLRNVLGAHSAILNTLGIFAMRTDSKGKPVWRSPSLSSAPLALERALFEARADGVGRRTIPDGEGGEFDVQIHWMELQDNAGLAAAVSLREVQKAENSLRQFVDTMSMTLAHLNMALIVFDSERRVALFNPAAVSMFDEQAEWLARQPHLREILDRMRDQRLIPEKTDYVAWRDEFLYRLSVVDGEEVEIDETWHQPGGGAISFTARSHPTGGLAVFIEDISEAVDVIRERAAERAVRLATTDLLEEAIAVVGPDGLVSFANRAFLRLWGFSDINKDIHVSELVHLCRTQCVETEFWDELQSNVLGYNHRRPVSTKIHHTDGPTLYARMTPSPDGATIVVFSDITDSEDMADTLRQRTEVLEQANEMRSALVGQISHQLRTPLNSINGFSQLLLNNATGPLTGLQRDYAEGLALAAQEMAQAVEGMNNIVTVDGDSISLSGELLDPRKLCQGVIRLVSGWTEYRNVSIETEFELAPSQFYAHQVRLRQIVFNMLSDAITNSRANGRIVFSVSGSESGQALFLVCVQHDATNADENGLALSLIRRFVQLHSGNVAVEMTAESLRQVTVRLPAAVAESKTNTGGVAVAGRTG